MEGHRSTFGDSRNCRFQVRQNPNVFSRVLNNNYHCSMVQGRNSNNFENTNSFSTANQLSHNSTNNYQPCYRLRRTNQPRLVGYDCCREGHLKGECKIQVMIEYMDLELRLQDKKNWMHRQVNVVDEVH